MGDKGDKSFHGPADFCTTHWTVVLAANQSESDRQQEALSALCQTYWYPLYVFVRRYGRSHHEAEDLTQEFFARILSKDGLASVRREKGRFRAFLLASMKHFLLNDHDRNRAAKRGGGCVVLSLDNMSAEERYLKEPAHGVTPEKLFEQSWALTVINSVLEGLKLEYTRAGKGPLFDAIHTYLESDAEGIYKEIADRLQLSEGAVKMAVLRLRQGFRERLRGEIANTVADAADVEPELQHLFTSLAH